MYLEGEEVRFPELADTLEAVGEGGVGIFYEGELARRISAYMLEMGGVITEEDLAEYEAVVREPMSVSYGAGAMYTNGPPSAGGPTLAQMLKVVSAYDLATMPQAEYVRVMAGAMKLALRDRETAYLDGSENSRVAERLTGRSTRRSSGAGSSPPSARRTPRISRVWTARAWPSRSRPAWVTGPDSSCLARASP